MTEQVSTQRIPSLLANTGKSINTAPISAHTRTEPTQGENAPGSVSTPVTPVTVKTTPTPVSDMKQQKQLPSYDGKQPKLGRIPYIGVPAEPIEFTILNTNAPAGGPDNWVLFDVFGYSGKANAAGVTTSMTSTVSPGPAGGSPITAFYNWISTKYYLLVNAIRIEADNLNQFNTQFWIQYYGLNGQPVGQPFPVNIASPTTQDSANPNPVVYFGLEFAIANNIVIYGTIRRNGGAGSMIMRLFVVDVDGYVTYA